MKVILHPLFIVVVLIAVFAGWAVFAFCLLGAVLIHEMSHAFVASRFGISTRQLCLLPFGAEIDIDCAYLTTGQRVLVLLAGSFGNIITALVAGGLLWTLPGFFIALEYIIVANAFPAILNLLPIYPLDGGKILYVLALSKGKRRADALVKRLYWASGASFLVLAVVNVIVVLNLMAAMICAVMLIAITFEFKNTAFVSKINTAMKSGTGKVVEVSVTSNMSLLEIYKHASTRCYTKFIVTDVIGKHFYENQLEEMLMKHSTHTKLKDAIF